LKELESFDELEFIEEEEEIFELGPEAIVQDKQPARQTTSANSSLKEIRMALKAGQWNEALAALRRQRAADARFELPKVELSCLADGFFKAHNVRDGRVFLEEYIRRFPDDADRHRVKLAVLYVKFLNKPKAALKLIANVDRNSLPEAYQPIHQQAARQAQQMISDGTVDSA
jgi:hypothetical protein